MHRSHMTKRGQGTAILQTHARAQVHHAGVDSNWPIYTRTHMLHSHPRTYTHTHSMCLCSVTPLPAGKQMKKQEQTNTHTHAHTPAYTFIEPTHPDNTHANNYVKTHTHTHTNTVTHENGKSVNTHTHMHAHAHTYKQSVPDTLTPDRPDPTATPDMLDTSHTLLYLHMHTFIHSNCSHVTGSFTMFAFACGMSEHESQFAVNVPRSSRVAFELRVQLLILVVHLSPQLFCC